MFLNIHENDSINIPESADFVNSEEYRVPFVLMEAGERLQTLLVIEDLSGYEKSDL